MVTRRQNTPFDNIPYALVEMLTGLYSIKLKFLVDEARDLCNADASFVIARSPVESYILARAGLTYGRVRLSNGLWDRDFLNKLMFESFIADADEMAFVRTRYDSILPGISTKFFANILLGQNVSGYALTLGITSYGHEPDNDPALLDKLKALVASTVGDDQLGYPKTNDAKRAARGAPKKRDILTEAGAIERLNEPIVMLDPDQLADARGGIDQLVEAALNAQDLSRSPRLTSLFLYIVQEELAGRGGRIKAYTIAMDVYGKEASFDAQNDSLVRVDMHRLRTVLERFIDQAPINVNYVVQIPRGSYRPRFGKRPRTGLGPMSAAIGL